VAYGGSPQQKHRVHWTEGPYSIANERIRRNITEGKPGVLLTLRLRVVDATTRLPIASAAVD